MKKIKIKPSYLKVFSYVYYLFLALGFGAVIFISFFLYQHFYLTMLELGNIVIAREFFEEEGEGVNMNKLDKVIKNIQSD